LLDQPRRHILAGITQRVRRRRQHHHLNRRIFYGHINRISHCLSSRARPRSGTSLSGQASYTVDPTLPRIAERADWLASHPDTARRLDRLNQKVAGAEQALGAERDQLDGILPGARDLARLPARTRELLDRLPAPVTALEPWWREPAGRDLGVERDL
jgi:hypothetical protein